MPVRQTACKANPIQVIRALSSRELRIVRAYDATPHASDNREPIAHKPTFLKFSSIVQT